MDAAEYDRDGRDRKSLSRLVFWFIVAAGGLFVFVQIYALIVGPYAEFAYDRSDKIADAREFITGDSCANPDKIAKVGSYRSTCEEARRRIAQGVWIGAFHDLMNDLKFCKQGICKFLGINFTSVLFFITLGAILMLGVAWCFGIAQFGSSYYARQIGMHQLPATMFGHGQPHYTMMPAPHYPMPTAMPSSVDKKDKDATVYGAYTAPTLYTREKNE
jgi:hypothetical protein